MNTIQLNAPAAVHEIVQKLEGAGYETWAVGGAVRDALLGYRVADWDLTTRARPDEVRRLFKRTVPVGIDHGTVGVLAKDGVMYEVTTFRRDIETFGRHAVVEFADSVEEDLARRDFTFNAIAWHPVRAELRDPFNGFDDLRAAKLRTVGSPQERFAEDYLRVLRALRFAGHFVMQIDPPTWEALRAATEHLPRLSAERIREELWKIFTKTRHASAALKLYESSGVLRVLFPELQAVVNLEKETGVPLWTHTLAAVDTISLKRPTLRFALLLHAVGAPTAKVKDLKGNWRFIGHEVLGARTAEEIMQRLRSSNADTEEAVHLIRLQSDLFPPDASDSVVRRWLVQMRPERVHDFFRFRIAHARGSGASGADLVERWRHAHRVMLAHPALAAGDLAINGRDLKALGLEPGPRFGEIIDALVVRVLDDPTLNEKDTLLNIVRTELRG
ncbi:MAG TPA: CCA tRNA nucleotidyltransferase [Longimicrobiales bacterium]